MMTAKKSFTAALLLLATVTTGCEIVQVEAGSPPPAQNQQQESNLSTNTDGAEGFVNLIAGEVLAKNGDHADLFQLIERTSLDMAEQVEKITTKASLKEACNKISFLAQRSKRIEKRMDSLDEPSEDVLEQWVPRIFKAQARLAAALNKVNKRGPYFEKRLQRALKGK